MPSFTDPAISAWQSMQYGPAALRGEDIIISKYRLAYKINFGSSGEVWKAYILDQGLPVALKVMRTPGFSLQADRAVEIAEIISRAGPNDRELFADIIDSGTHARHRYLVFPLLGMSLGTLIGDGPQSLLLPCQKKGIMRQVAAGIEFLHSLSIVHTDLKPDNIVLVDDVVQSASHMDENGQLGTYRDIKIKIIDLEDSKTLTAKRTSCIGTIGYTAPEVYSGIGWGFAADIFAFGCIIYEVQFHKRFLPDITGLDVMFAYLERSICSFRPPLVKEIREHLPFLFDDSVKSPRVIVRGADIHFVRSQVKIMKDVMRSFVSDGSYEFKDLMRKCLNVDARQRPTALECSRHNFFFASNDRDAQHMVPF